MDAAVGVTGVEANCHEGMLGRGRGSGGVLPARPLIDDGEDGYGNDDDTDMGGPLRLKSRAFSDLSSCCRSRSAWD